MLSEADTRAKLIDPAIHACGWTEDLIKREETAGAIEIDDATGTVSRRAKSRIKYTLRVKVNPETQPVALALIEAKASHLPPMEERTTTSAKYLRKNGRGAPRQPC